MNRKINAALLLDLIRKQTTISRADLAKMTGIRATSVSAIVQQLLEQNLVREVGLGKSTGGRQPSLLELNPGGIYAIGIEISDTGINAVLVNFLGTVLQKVHKTIRNTDVNTIAEQIKNITGEISRKSSIALEEIAGIGIALPGIISKDEGHVILSGPLNWQNVSLKEIIQRKTGLNVSVINNAIAGALTADYEINKGDAHTLLYFMICLRNATHNSVTTMGCGIVMDGRAYLGDGHLAGEIRVDIPHPVLLAGKYSREQVAHIYDLISRSVSHPDIYAPVWDSFSHSIGSVIARGVDFINPGRIIIGTDIPELESLIADYIHKVIFNESMDGVIAERLNKSQYTPTPMDFMLLETETLAKGAIIPRLQELSLAPLLRKSALM